jgi:hypothetical protein
MGNLENANVLCPSEKKAESAALAAVRSNNTPETRQQWHDVALKLVACEQTAVNICEATFKESFKSFLSA